MRPNVISLLTDFGMQDNYVGVMKGVILSILPGARLVDITHEIPRHSIEHAAFLLERSYRFFPPGTVHLVVVDPGVGSARRPIAVRADKHMFVCPDNGVLSHVLANLDEWEAREIENRDFLLPQISKSFHGRDLFAPVAAHLAKSVPFEQFGPRLEDLFLLPAKKAETQEGLIEGNIVYIDRYGNLISNIEESLLESLGEDTGFTVQIGDLDVMPIHSSYSSVPENQPVAIVGGFGTLEIAVNQGNAHEMLEADLGTIVRVRKKA